MARDSRVDAYIESRAGFAQPILAWLRDRVHAACPRVDETIKWSRPFFTLDGRPFANMAAFTAHVSFGFWDRTAGEGGAALDERRISAFDDLPDPAEMEARIAAAAALRDAGQAPSRAARPQRPEAQVPADLAAALAGDPAAAATFAAFPPSARRDYCEWIDEAKRAETRARRVGDAISWLRDGKRRNWKFETR
ncbi:MAG: YdeI/OmpD-associated family protein [Sphingomonas sp.]